MRRMRVQRAIAAGLILAGAAMLSGCSAGGFAGASAFGSSKLAVAEISDIGSYTADSALAGAKAHFRNGNYGHSAALYKRAVELAPKRGEAYVGLGASYDQLGRFDLADRVYSSLYELSGGTAQYYNNLGYSNLLRGNLTAALSNFRKAQKLDPENLVVANNIRMLSDAASAGKA